MIKKNQQTQSGIKVWEVKFFKQINIEWKKLKMW
jgi:hypothetical protein